MPTEKQSRRVLPLIFRACALIRVPKRRTAQNRIRNQCAEAALGDTAGCINGQGLGPVAGLRYGLCRYRAVGCEVIATYNALRLLGVPATLGELGYRYESGGGTMLLGAWGTNPYAVERVLSELGVPFRRFEEAAALAVELKTRQRGICILSFWNDRHNPFRGVHTVTAEFRADRTPPCLAYNRYDNVPHAVGFESLDAVLGNGCLIVGYLVEPRVGTK